MARFFLTHIITLVSFVLLVLVEESFAEQSVYDPEFLAKIRPLAVVFLVLAVLISLTLIILAVIVCRNLNENGFELEEKPGISKHSFKTSTYAYDNRNYRSDSYYVDIQDGKKAPPPSSEEEMSQTNGKQKTVGEQYVNPVYETAD